MIGRSTSAHVVLDLFSLLWGFGESCTIYSCYHYHYTANVFSKCALLIDIVIDLHPFGCILKLGLFTHPIGVVEGKGSRGWVHWMVCHWTPFRWDLVLKSVPSDDQSSECWSDVRRSCTDLGKTMWLSAENAFHFWREIWPKLSVHFQSKA